MLGVLAAHGPRTISGAFGVGLDGIELVARPDVNRAIRSDGGGGFHITSRFKFPKESFVFCGVNFRLTAGTRPGIGCGGLNGFFLPTASKTQTQG